MNNTTINYDLLSNLKSIYTTDVPIINKVSKNHKLNACDCYDTGDCTDCRDCSDCNDCTPVDCDDKDVDCSGRDCGDGYND